MRNCLSLRLCECKYIVFLICLKFIFNRPIQITLPNSFGSCPSYDLVHLPAKGIRRYEVFSYFPNEFCSSEEPRGGKMMDAIRFYRVLWRVFVIYAVLSRKQEIREGRFRLFSYISCQVELGRHAAVLQQLNSAS